MEMGETEREMIDVQCNLTVGIHAMIYCYYGISVKLFGNKQG